MARDKQKSKATFHVYGDSELLEVVEIPLVEPKSKASGKNDTDESRNPPRSNTKRKSA